MKYTVISARWGNAEHSSAVIITVECAAVAISAFDTPVEWAAFVNWAKDNQVADAPAARAPMTKQQKFDRWLTSVGMTAAEVKAQLG